MPEERYATWLISYNMDGSQWSMSIVAKDADDAMRRLKQAATWGTVDGEMLASVPVWRGGFLIPLVCRVRNRLLRRGGAATG